MKHALITLGKRYAADLKAMEKHILGIHHCPECGWGCSCSDQPCSCCKEAPIECEHDYVPDGEYDQNGQFICSKCKNKI